MKCLHMKGFILLKIWCWDIQAQHLQETLEACGIFGFCLNHLPEGTVKATTGCSLIWNHAKGFIHYPWRQDTAQGSRVERNLLGSGRAVYLGVKLSLRRFALFCTWDMQGKKAVGAAGCPAVVPGVWGPGCGWRIQRAGWTLTLSNITDRGGMHPPPPARATCYAPQAKAEDARWSCKAFRIQAPWLPDCSGKLGSSYLSLFVCFFGL